MSDSREQFEAWVRENWPEQSLARFVTGEYQGFTVEHCWNAWQASRQALEVVLPEPIMTPRNASSYVEGEHDGIERGIRMCRESIEAAGVRVKPCS